MRDLVLLGIGLVVGAVVGLVAVVVYMAKSWPRF